jgi:acyl-coenzyme A thioesterase PaaI-like protein
VLFRSYTTHNGPFFHRDRDGRLEHAFFALKRHCNSLGIVHGGMLSTFMDGVLAGAVGRATGGPSVTVHLSLDFLAMARAGEWLTGEARITRKTRDLVFAEGWARVGGRDVLRASGVFKPMHRRAD